MAATVYVCNSQLHIRNETCLDNSSTCGYEAKKFEGTAVQAGSYGYAIASTLECKVFRMNGTNKLKQIDGFAYAPFEASGGVVCGDTILPTECRQFDYSVCYTYTSSVAIDKDLIKYAPNEWADEEKLAALQERTSSRRLVLPDLPIDSSLLPYLVLGAIAISIGLWVGLIFMWWRQHPKIFTRRPKTGVLKKRPKVTFQKEVPLMPSASGPQPDARPGTNAGKPAAEARIEIQSFGNDYQEFCNVKFEF